MLFVISAALTAFWNGFLGIIKDFAANLYVTGFVTVVLSLSLHVLVVRRVLPRSSFPCLLLGVVISGLLSFVLYDLVRGYTAHMTYLQRADSAVNWGDEGRRTGLGPHALGILWPMFATHVPFVLKAGLFYGALWFPLLLWLERWSYADSRSAVGAASP